MHDGHWTAARSLATELALITPSSQGSTAFDRLARARRPELLGEASAIGLLRRSVPRIARLSGQRFEDLVTGEIWALAPSPPSEISGDGDVFGRFAVMDGGTMIATGMLLVLDAQLARGGAWNHPAGPNGANPGEPGAVRRSREPDHDAPRHGGDAPPEREPVLPFDPKDNPLDALAAEWAALGG